MDGINTGLKLSTEKALVFALQLAEKGKGLVEPNPCVGCVLLNDSNEVVSYGFHQKFGEAHAEVNAFEGVSDEGLTAIVTLEPCSHYGKTPPCAELLVAKKIKKLIYIDADPNPRVSGKGLQLLRENNVEVEKAPEQYSQINRQLNARFFYFHETGQSFFHTKWAQTLDGKMSLHGQSKWITNEKAREYGHYLRAQNEAVLIGKNTLLNDDPLLNARLPQFIKNNRIVVLDPKLELVQQLNDMNISKVREPKDIILVHSLNSAPKTTTTLIKAEMVNETTFDLKKLKQALAQKLGIQSVFIEGGPSTLGHFLDQKCVDFASIFIAPKISGENGKSYSDQLNIKSLSESYELTKPVVRTLENNILIESEISF